MLIEFVVPAIPVAQPRQRTAVIAGHAHNYTPASHPVVAFKALCSACASAAYHGPPLEGALSVHICFVFPRPQSMRWKRRPQPRAWHTGRGDIDNCAKAVLDALKWLWQDDAHVALLNAQKFIAAGDEQPHVEIAVETMNHAD